MKTIQNPSRSIVRPTDLKSNLDKQGSHLSLRQDGYVYHPEGSSEDLEAGDLVDHQFTRTDGVKYNAYPVEKKEESAA